MPLSPGTSFGSYEVLAPLGAGGMGEVYRARDLKLQREVALKVLPAAVANDADRRARFEREAYVLAALNHPRIAAIHGVAEHQGTTALVLELVDGATLDERLRTGPLPLDEAITIARQIAEALDAAHQAGIVHRDLKPANVKLRSDDSVKVLDFGLAKAVASPSSLAGERADAETALATGTSAGLILGTPAYMAPEQARGLAVDKRADIWAFGVVLWEMVTGRPLFQGKTVTDTLAAVLTCDIDWSQLPARTPPAISALLRRCLERDPKKRLRDIGDAPLDGSLLTPSSAAAPTAPTGPRWWLWGAGVAAALAGGFVIGSWTRPAATAPSVPEVRFTFAVSQPNFPAISPDGSMIAIASDGPLQVRDLSGVPLRVLDGTDGAIKPFWSPDSRSIGFGRGGRLWHVSATGGPPTVICNLTSWDHDAGGAWLADGTILFATGGAGIMRVPAGGGEPEVYLAADGPEDLHFHFAHALPKARGLLYVVHRQSGPDTLELYAKGTRKVLLQTPGESLHDPVYSPSGHILFARTPVNEGVWALPFSLERLQAIGTPSLVESAPGSPSVSTTGTLVYLPTPTAVPTRLRWFSPNGTPLDAASDTGVFDPHPALSHDGTYVAIGERVDGAWGLSAFDLTRGTRVRLAVGDQVSAPAWAPDGRSIVYGTVAADGIVKQVWLDGTRAESFGPGFRPAVSRNGVLLFDRMVNNDFDLLAGPLDRTGPVGTFVGGGLPDVSPRPSPDGRLVAYMSLQSLVAGNPEMVLRRYPAGDERWQVSSGGGWWPRWSATGNRLFYRTPGGIYEVSVTTSNGQLALSRPRRLFERRALTTPVGPDGFDVAKDGRLLLVELASSSTERDVHVVLNWTP